MSRSVSSDSVSGSHAAVEDVDIEEGQHQTPTNHVQSKSDLPSSFIATREKSRLVARSVIARTHDHHSHMNQPVGPLPTSSDAPTSISEACSSTNSDDGWRWGKKSWVIIRRHPIPTVLAPLLLLAVLVGLGVYGVIAASNTYTSNLQASANALVNNAARSFGDQINLVWSPQDTLAKIIQANPNLDYWRNNFKNISDGLLDYAEDKAADGVLVMLQIQPHGISRMFANPYLPGLLDGACTDLLTSPGNPQQAAFMMSVIVKGAAGGAAVFNGPLSTTDAATGQVYPISAWLLNPVFIHNVSKDEDFGYSYSDSPAATQCVESGPCYNATTRSKWWGYTTSFFSFGPLITGNQSILSGIPEHGFSYKLTAPAAYTSQPMIVGQVGQVVDEGSVRCEFNIPYKRDNVVTANPWVLSIYPNNGWDPTWKTPLIVAVVVISIVVSLLVSVTIVGLYRQRDLLKESQDTNGKLLTLAHSLEEEKKSTYALVARQLALIECLGREAAEAQGQFHKKTHGDGDDLMMGKGSSSLVIDPEIKALSVHQIDLIRKDLIDRTSKRMSRASVALLDQGSEIPDLEILHIVGEGSFGKVFKCLWRGSPVALKTLVLPSNMSRQEKREKMAVMEVSGCELPISL